MNIVTQSLLIFIFFPVYFCFDKLGANAFQQRIEGGRPATPGEASYQLSLQTKDGDHFCGASLVEVMGVQVAISAAHCFQDERVRGPFYVVAGDVALNDTTGAEQKRLVAGIIIHPGFDQTEAPQFANDLSILFFYNPFQLNANVSIIRLPPREMKNVEGDLIVTGWGNFHIGGPLSPQLQLVELEIFGDSTCKLAWNSGSLWFVESMMCAGTMTGGYSPCQGDSGGPAVLKGAQYLLGIVSFGSLYDCGHPNYPAVYTEVAYYIDWIENQVAYFQP